MGVPFRRLHPQCCGRRPGTHLDLPSAGRATGAAGAPASTALAGRRPWPHLQFGVSQK